ncbi:unnamed protein product [Pylaiella littoralis]
MGELLREIGKGESLIVWIGLSYCCFVVDAVSVGGDTLSCSVCEHAVLRCLLDALKRTQWQRGVACGRSTPPLFDHDSCGTCPFMCTECVCCHPIYSGHPSTPFRCEVGASAGVTWKVTRAFSLFILFYSTNLPPAVRASGFSCESGTAIPSLYLLTSNSLPTVKSEETLSERIEPATSQLAG